MLAALLPLLLAHGQLAPDDDGSGCARSDRDGSGAVDVVDLLLLLSTYGTSEGGAGLVVGVDQLLRLLNDDLLPRFSRIFSDRTTECEGEKELLEYSSPESQSVWLKEHLDALRDTVTQQIEALFGEPAGDEVLGQRRAAAALAKGGS